MDSDLRQLLHDSQAQAAVRSRAGIGALQERHGEDATVLGLLANLVDLATPIALTTVRGLTVHGIVAATVSGGVAIECNDGLRLVRSETIAAVRCSEGIRLDGDGQSIRAMSWPTLIASFLEPGDQIATTVGGSIVRGELQSLSRSVLQLRLVDHSRAYIVLVSIEELSVNEPGSIRHDTTKSSRSVRMRRITRPKR